MMFAMSKVLLPLQCSLVLGVSSGLFRKKGVLDLSNELATNLANDLATAPCAPLKPFAADDNCNICVCPSSGNKVNAQCTEKVCTTASPPAMSDTCVPLSYLVSKEECMACVCPADGNSSMALCETDCDSPTPVPTPSPLNICTVNDDPHVKSFDGGQVSFLFAASKSPTTLEDKYSSGLHWLVKSPSVSIQAKILPDKKGSSDNMFMRLLAVGGTFMKGNILIVGPLNGNILWNDQEILKEQEGRFLVPRLINSKRSLNSFLVQDASKRNPGVEIELPRSIKLTINRLPKYLNAAIAMPRLDDGQDGMCGNYNGNTEDDGIVLSTMRGSTEVESGESLIPLQ